MKTASREFAQALYLVASEGKEEHLVLNGIELLSHVFSQQPQYIELLRCPSISASERKDALSKAIENRVCQSLELALYLMIDKNIIDNYEDVFSEYKGIYDELNGVIDAMVTSAVELSEEQKNKITKKLENMYGKRVSPTFAVDKKIIGGVKIEADGSVIDGSVMSKLNDLREVIRR